MDGKTVFKWRAAVVWGIVMGLYEAYPNVLHMSLKKSMNEIYRRGLPTMNKGEFKGERLLLKHLPIGQQSA